MSPETNPDQFPGESLDPEGWEALVAPGKVLQSDAPAPEAPDPTTRPPPCERAVYLALRMMSVFRKHPTQCNKPRLLTAIRKRRKNSETIKVLFQNHDAEAIYSTAFRLYECGAFTDKETAAEMFPDDQENIEGSKKKDPIYLHSFAQTPLVTTLQKGVTYACYAYLNEQEPCLLQDLAFQAESADLEQLLGIAHRSTSITPDQTRLFELMGDLARASGTEWKDVSKLTDALKAAESFVSLLGNRSGQTVLSLLRSGTEAELAELVTKGRAHQDKVREELSYITAEREKLDQEEKNLLNAFQAEERVFVKDATKGVIRGVRMAEDALVDKFLELHCLL